MGTNLGPVPALLKSPVQSWDGYRGRIFRVQSFYIFLPKRRYLLGAVRDAYGLHGRGGAQGNPGVHQLRGGDVPAFPDHRPLPQVRLALPALLEAVRGSLGPSLSSR